MTLSQGGKVLATTVTDGFGDFRFDNLARDGGAYRVEVSHAHGSAWRDCVLCESVYLGELRLNRLEETEDQDGSKAGKQASPGSQFGRDTKGDLGTERSRRITNVQVPPLPE